MKIENRNVSIPVTNDVTTQSVAPGSDRMIQDSEDKIQRTKMGIASAQDTFEDLAESRSVIDPIGYPGEEWLWQENAVDPTGNGPTLMSAAEFELDGRGNLHIHSTAW